jgi:predicted nucleic acid-binding protein
VKGVEVYDARIVASMNVHGIGHLLTFDINDFKRYKGISVVSPADVR